MKKVLTVLTIMMVLVSGIFAATIGDAEIKVTANIALKEPTFKLQVGTTKAGVGDEDKEYSITSPEGLIAASGTVSVSCAVLQVSDAKMFGGYDFEVTVTDLVLVDEKPGTITDSDWATITANSKFTKVAENPTFTAHAKYASLDGFATITGNNTTALTVTYLGGLVASEASPKEIGTFTCAWNANSKAITGNYEATVTLTIISAS